MKKKQTLHQSLSTLVHQPLAIINFRLGVAELVIVVSEQNKQKTTAVETNLEQAHVIVTTYKENK